MVRPAGLMRTSASAPLRIRELASMSMDSGSVLMAMLTCCPGTAWDTGDSSEMVLLPFLAQPPRNRRDRARTLPFLCSSLNFIVVLQSSPVYRESANAFFGKNKSLMNNLLSP